MKKSNAKGVGPAVGCYLTHPLLGQKKLFFLLAGLKSSKIEPGWIPRVHFLIATTPAKSTKKGRSTAGRSK